MFFSEEDIMNYKLSGQIISEKRRELGLTQKELAASLHISNKTVSKWECGEGFPDISLVLPLCDALGISVESLISGSDVSCGNAEDERVSDTISALLREQTAQEKKEKRAVGVKIILTAVFSVLLVLSFTAEFVYPISNTLRYYGLQKYPEYEDYVIAGKMRQKELAGLIDYYILSVDPSSAGLFEESGYMWWQDSDYLISVSGSGAELLYDVIDLCDGIEYRLRKAPSAKDFSEASAYLLTDTQAEFKAYDFCRMSKASGVSVYKNFWTFLEIRFFQ